MRAFILVTVACGLLASRAAAQSPAADGADADPIGTIRAKCADEWRADYRMQVYCVNQQQTALETWQRGAAGLNVNLGWSPQPVLMLRAKCAGEWPTDFHMRVVCVTQQQTALQTLHQRSAQIDGDPVLRELRARCLAEWSTPAPPGPEGRAAKAERWFTDYRMMNRCEQQQLKALNSLQGG